MTNNQRVEQDEDEAFCDLGTVLYIGSLIVLGVLLGIAFGPIVNGQEEGIGLEDVPQKELTGIPVNGGGVLEQTWNWFIELLGYDVPDVEVVKRSILEQDLAIDDVRLVDVYDTIQGPYQVIVTPKETYDVPDKTTCYDDGSRYVCESTLRCDGLPGVEYGCEHVIVDKLPTLDGGVTEQNMGRAPIRPLITRKEVLLNPNLVIDGGLTKRLPEAIVDEVKASIVPIEEVAIE